jgi:hypothetical protein
MADTDYGTVFVTDSKNSAFKISDFKNAIGKPVRPNLFKAILDGWESNEVLNALLRERGVSDINDFSFRCEKAEFPGRSIATSDDTGGGGPALKLPYDVTYNDITISVICSPDMKERVFFESWIDSIVGPASGERNGTPTGGLISYFNDYARGVTLVVNQLDEAGNTLIRYRMNDVYPITISPMNATWEEVNSYQRFGVTFFYRHYSFSKPKTT